MNAPLRAARGPLKQALILFGVAVACWSLVGLTPLRTYLLRFQDIRDLVLGFGVLGPMAFAAAVALLVMVGMPRLALCTLAGFVFGFTGGLFWCTVGTLVGYYLMFLGVRSYSPDLALEKWERCRHLCHIVSRNGFTSVCLARLLPINGFTTNIALGLSPVSHKDYLAGTAVGLLPEAIPFTLLGTGAVQHSMASLVYAFVAAAFLLGFGMFQHMHAHSSVAGDGSHAIPRA